MTTGIAITLAVSAIVILYTALFKKPKNRCGIEIDFDRAKEHELNKR